MKTTATKSFDPKFQTRGADARSRMSSTARHNALLDAIERGERPAMMHVSRTLSIPLDDAWFETLTKQVAERKRICAADDDSSAAGTLK